MATEENETESGGQTDDSDAGESEDTPVDDGGEQQSAGAEGEKPKTGARDKRRGNRFREVTERATAAEARAIAAEQRASMLEGQFNDFRQQIERDRQQAQQSSASGQTKEKISGLRQQARNFLIQAANPKLEPTEAQRLLDKHDELMDEANDLRDEMRDSTRWEKRKGELAGQIPNQEVLAERSYIEGRYPWISNNNKARLLADAHYMELVQSGKRQPGRATLEEAITWAGKTLGLGGRGGSASNLSRQVYAGTGQRDGELDNSEPSGSMTAEDVKNTLALKRMATLTFNQDDPEVAYQKFAAMQNKANKNGANAR